MATASNSIIFTQDFRATAQDYKRDSNSKHKWELGEAYVIGRPVTHPRPRRPLPKGAKVLKVTAAKTNHRNAINLDHGEAVTDSSCDEDVIAPDSATLASPDAGVAYSFDASRGPSHGSQVLATALDQALAKFENTVTDKLVRDEYEVLGSGGEAVVVAKTGKKVGKTAAAAAAAQGDMDEDEYEFV